jgi:MFS family permease
VRLLAVFHRPKLERDALRGYRHERFNQFLQPTALALMEGGFVGVIADKVYHVHPLVLAVIATAPMIGNISSFAWARWMRGRRKVPLVAAIQTAIAVGVGLVALAPQGPAGAALLVTSLVAVRLLITGELTVRSTIWSHNYPREVRARITGRLQLAMTLVTALTSLGAGWFLDRNPESFRSFYLISALAAWAGAVVFARVPHIGGEQQLEQERREPELRQRSVRDVLRADPLFARYQACQFALGASSMIIDGSIVLLVSRQLEASYLWSTAIVVGLPTLLSAATMPMWAAYIDRVHIARFRVTQSGFWLAYMAMLWYGAAQGSLAWIALSRAVLGLSRGGGNLAWQLGHNDFSSPRDLAAYMGAHVTLTGVRGAFAPLAGIVLFAGLEPSALFPFAIPALGSHTFGLCLALALASTIGFIRLDRAITRARRAPRAAAAEPSAPVTAPVAAPAARTAALPVSAPVALADGPRRPL